MSKLLRWAAVFLFFCNANAKLAPKHWTIIVTENITNSFFRSTTVDSCMFLLSQNAFEEVNKLIYNSNDFTVSAYAKLGTSEIYKNHILSINSKDGNQLYFLLQISWVLRLFQAKFFFCQLNGELILPLWNVSLILSHYLAVRISWYMHEYSTLYPWIQEGSQCRWKWLSNSYSMIV